MKGGEGEIGVQHKEAASVFIGFLSLKMTMGTGLMISSFL